MYERRQLPGVPLVRAVRISLVGLHSERPPKVRLDFTIILRNEWNKPRWFLLPDLLTSSPRLFPGMIEAIDVYKFGGNGNVVVGHFRGSGGFQALLLPAEAEITLRDFPIPMWATLPRSISIQVVVASQLEVAGEPADHWFELNPLSDASADVQVEALAEQKHVVAGRHAPFNSEVAVTIAEFERMQFEVSLS